MPTPKSDLTRRNLLQTTGLTVAGAVALNAVSAAHTPNNQSSIISAPTANAQPTTMHAGRGIADMTGEPLGAGMNGYAVMEQVSAGLAQRQYARTFILGQGSGERVVLTVADIGLMFQSIHLEVLRRLRREFGGRYHAGNVLISASHTHSGPGGTSGHVMVNMPGFGFRPATFEATVSGIVESIRRADRDYAPTEVTVSHSEVTGIARNRSIHAFNRNPAAEKQRYPGGIDPSSISLHLKRNGNPIGVMNWFAIHPTQLPPTNTHIHGDNKGVAAWVTEKRYGVRHSELPNAPYVAAFAQTAPGDVSGNLKLREGTGLADNPEDNTWIVGNRLADDIHASEHTGQPLSGAVTLRYAWRDMAKQRVPGRWTEDGKPGKTGPAILGAAFAASSQEDGGGVEWLPFMEGERGGSPMVAQLNKVTVPREVSSYQSPKESLLPVGYIPGMLQETFPFHLVRIGDIVIAALSFEPTVMAGHRLRRTIADAMNLPERNIIVQGYTSGYGHYVTTPEEYQQQDYEGGATPFGRHQLPATQMIFHELASALADDKKVPVGQPAGDLTGKIPTSPSAGPPVDVPLPGRKFGDSLRRIPDVRRGDVVTAEFCGANPNNNLRHGDTYLRIELWEDGKWETVATDNYWSVRLHFDVSGWMVTSRVTWSTHKDVAPGRYRIRYFGDWRDAGGRIHPFIGRTNEFRVR